MKQKINNKVKIKVIKMKKFNFLFTSHVISHVQGGVFFLCFAFFLIPQVIQSQENRNTQNKSNKLGNMTIITQQGNSNSVITASRVKGGFEGIAVFNKKSKDVKKQKKKMVMQMTPAKGLSFVKSSIFVTHPDCWNADGSNSGCAKATCQDCVYNATDVSKAFCALLYGELVETSTTNVPQKGRAETSTSKTPALKGFAKLHSKLSELWIMPREVMLPFGGTIVQSFYLCTTKAYKMANGKGEWTIKEADSNANQGGTNQETSTQKASTSANSIAVTFSDAEPEKKGITLSGNKFTVNYNTPGKYTVECNCAQSQSATVTIVGIKDLSCVAEKVTDSILTTHLKQYFPKETSNECNKPKASAEKVDEGAANIQINLYDLVAEYRNNKNLLKLQGNVKFSVNPDPMPSDKTVGFPPGYPIWYSSSPGAAGLVFIQKQKNEYTMSIADLIKRLEKEENVTIAVKCGEKDVNHETKKDADANGESKEGNERFCSHSITFSANAIKMISPAGVYKEPSYKAVTPSKADMREKIRYYTKEESWRKIKDQRMPEENQFVFDENEDGNLMIEFKAQIFGSKEYIQETNKYVYHFFPGKLENYKGRILRAITDEKGKIQYDANGEICTEDISDTVATDGIKASFEADNVISATVIYKGMPETNEAFGFKEVQLTGKIKKDQTPKLELFNPGTDKAIATSNYEVFFNADGKAGFEQFKKNKGKQTDYVVKDGMACPNWFYYWRKGNVCTLLQDARYDETLDSETNGMYQDGANCVKIGRTAIDHKDTDNEERGLKWDDKEDFSISVNHQYSGLRSVAITAKHELTHKEIYESRKEKVNKKYRTKECDEVWKEIINDKSIPKSCQETELLIRLTKSCDTDSDIVSNTLEEKKNKIEEKKSYKDIRSDSQKSDTFEYNKKFHNGKEYRIAKYKTKLAKDKYDKAAKKAEAAKNTRLAETNKWLKEKAETAYKAAQDAEDAEKGAGDGEAVDDYKERLKKKGEWPSTELEQATKIVDYFDGYAKYGDNEVRARFESGKVEEGKGKDYYPQNDWAYPGSNSFIYK